MSTVVSVECWTNIAKYISEPTHAQMYEMHTYHFLTENSVNIWTICKVASNHYVFLNHCSLCSRLPKATTNACKWKTMTFIQSSRRSRRKTCNLTSNSKTLTHFYPQCLYYGILSPKSEPFCYKLPLDRKWSLFAAASGSLVHAGHLKQFCYQEQTPAETIKYG